MDKTVLLWSYDSRSIRGLRRRLKGNPFSWVFLGRNPGDYKRINETLGADGDCPETADRFHQASEELRSTYLTYLYDAGQRQRSLNWSLTSLSCRSGYVSGTYQQLCFLKLAIDLAENHEGPHPLVFLADAPLRRALNVNLSRLNGVRIRAVGWLLPSPLRLGRDTAKMLVHRAYFVCRESYRVILARLIIRRPFQPQTNTLAVFCWATITNVRLGGYFLKSYFGNLAIELTKLGYQVAPVPMIRSEVPYHKAISSLTAGPDPVLVPHRSLKLRDVAAVAISTLGKTAWPKAMPDFEGPGCPGMNLNSLAEDELNTNWISNGSADALLMARVVRRWRALGIQVQRMIYVYENQPWERALCSETRKQLPGCALVGYQDAAVPPLLLNYYLAPGGEPDAPLPDQIVTVGTLTSGLLSSAGYPPGILRVGGAIQMRGFFENEGPANQPLPSDPGPTILIAPSIGLEEAAELIEAAVGLFDIGDGIKVVFKCHPIMPFPLLNTLLGIELPEHTSVSEEPIADLMRECSLMVYTSSSVVFQALALSLPVLHFRTRFELDLDPLKTSPDMRREATDPEELRKEVRWLLEHRDQYIDDHRQQWRELVHEMYGPVTPETYRAFVE